jgi:hypothetical protein
MPWPEKDLLTRVLAGVVGGLLGALLGFILFSYGYFTLRSPTSLVLWATGIGGAVGFLSAFLFGDAVVRFLARLV